MALDQTVQIISEGLARIMGRRQFVKQAGGALFGGLAALAAGHMVPSEGAAASLGEIPCAPPGPYCNLDGHNEPNGCRGSSCYQHVHAGELLYCRVYYIYQAGCWTTPWGGGHWTCCDCRCSREPGGGGIAACGCAQFSLNPVPRPDAPGAEAAK